MKNILLALTFSIVLLSGCGRLTSDADVQSDEGVDPKLVALADGTIMDVACVRANAQNIIANGRGAADSCVMGNAQTKTDADGRGFSSSYYPSWYSGYYVYPPTYYNGNYGNLCGYLGFYGSGYSSTYGYGYGYGYGTGYNCYNAFLGYDPYYTGSYNNNCDYCLNRANPNRCYNRCLYQGNSWGSWQY